MFVDFASFKMDSLNSTFNAVLDAASASVASVTPQATSRGVATSSKSHTFVSFDDLVSVTEKGGVSCCWWCSYNYC